MNLILTLPAVLLGLFWGFFGQKLQSAPTLLLLACGLWVVALAFCLRPKPSLPLWLFASGGGLAVVAHLALAIEKLLR
jgi:hypothetical protein